MASSSLVATYCTLLVLCGVALGYWVRVRVKGRAKFERVERQGGGLLLGKRVMEMGYWGMQPLATALIALRVSANTISGGSFVIGGIAGGCLAFGSFGWAGVFAGLSGVLDALDGRVARMTGTASRSGKVIDSSLDRYVEFFFIAGLVHYYGYHPVLQWIALFALLGSFMVSYSTALAEIFRIDLGPGAMRRPERLFCLILAAILSPLSIEYLETSGNGIFTAYPMVISLALIAVIANCSAAARLLRIKRILDAQQAHQRLQVLPKASGRGLGIGLNVGPGASGPVMNERLVASPHAPE